MTDWIKERERFPLLKSIRYLRNASNTPISSNVYKASEKANNLLYREYLVGDIPFVEQYQSITSTLSELYGGLSTDWSIGPSTSYLMNLIGLMLKDQGEILTFKDEYPSSLIPFEYQNFVLNISPTTNAVIDLELVKKNLTSNTNAVILSHVQYSTGYRSTLKEIAHYLDENNIEFIIDASQSLGAFSIDVNDIPISALCCSLQKWICGMYGGSLFYTSHKFRKKYQFPFAGPVSFNQDKPRIGTGFSEVGTGSLNLYYSLNAALTEIKRIGQKNISIRILELNNYLENKLSENNIKQIYKQVHDEHKSGIIFIQISNSLEALKSLEKNNIIINEMNGLLRVSFHYFNNFQDLDLLVNVLIDQSKKNSS